MTRLKPFYDDYCRDFAKERAYAILETDSGYSGTAIRHLGNIVFKNSQSNTTTKCYLNIFTLPMVCARVNGSDETRYNRALYRAIEKLKIVYEELYQKNSKYGFDVVEKLSDELREVGYFSIEVMNEFKLAYSLNDSLDTESYLIIRTV